MFTVGAIVFIGATNPWIIIILPVALVLVVVVTQYQVRRSVPVKRLEATMRSPIFSHLATTFQGLSLIRCHHAQAEFTTTLRKLIDAHSRLALSTNGNDRWFVLRLVAITNLLLAFMVFMSIYFRDLVSVGNVALGIVYSVTLLAFFQFASFRVSQVA